mgnify:CR=1 FL=1
MSYSEAMRYATEVEKGVEMEIYRREMEQQQYEEEMEELKEEIMDSFHSFKEKNYNKLNESEWDELEEYIEDYIVEEDTTFDNVLEQYYDYITDKFSFLV